VVLSLLGDSGAGKTLLATALIARWKARGLRVGYVKHASHGFEMDRPRKDTYRATESGADGVVVTGPGGTAFLEPLERSDDPLELVGRFLADRDVVVLEGFREAALPSVVIAAPGESPREASVKARGELLAVVSAQPGPARAAVYAPEAVEPLALHLDRALSIRQCAQQEVEEDPSSWARMRGNSTLFSR
jgi:molybdopterin-guanine dinucleotide biosynthesis protein MobB